MEENEPRVYLLMRGDLRMRRGKEIAQACHAMTRLHREGAPSEPFAVITLKVDRIGLDDALLVAMRERVATYCVRDAGRTEVEPGTLTCAAIGPTTRRLFEHFPLY